MTKCSLGMSGLRKDQLRAAFAYAKERIKAECVVDARWAGRGIIICGGGRYLSWTLANVRNCRARGWEGPIQVWCLNSREIPDAGIFERLGVEVVNAQDRLLEAPMRRFGGWTMKMWSVLHCPFREVLFLDADCFATGAGLRLFESREFTETGALFLPDISRCHQSDLAYFSCHLVPPRMMKPPREEFETGAFLVDKGRAEVIAAMRLAVWMSEHSEAWWALGHGDKLTTELAWRGSGLGYGWGESEWRDWGIEHRVGGEWCFSHLLGVKRGKAAMPVLD